MYSRLHMCGSSYLEATALCAVMPRSRQQRSTKEVSSAVFSAYMRKNAQKRKQGGGGQSSAQPIPEAVAARFLCRYQEWYRQYVQEFRPSRSEADDEAGTTRYMALAKFLSSDRKARIRFSAVPNSTPRVVQSDVTVIMPEDQGGGKAKRTTQKKKASGGRVHAHFHGITRRLRESMWPNNSSRYADVPSRAADKSSFNTKCQCYGEKHGSRVHNQVQEIVNNYLIHERDLKEYVHSLYKNRQQTLDPCVITVFKILKAARLVPLCSEFPIFDEAIGVATQIDMVCVSDRGAGVFIELKTGYPGPFATATEDDRNMDLHLPNMAFLNSVVMMPVKDTPFMRAVLQLVDTMLITQVRYGYSPRKGYILHISKNEERQPSHLYELPAIFTTSPHSALARKLVYQRLATTTPKACRKRLKRGQMVANEVLP